MPGRQSELRMLYHDEELDEEELNKCFAKFDSRTIELILKEYRND
jgi:hypothetical protein